MRTQNLARRGHVRTFGDIDLSNPAMASIAGLVPSLTFSTNLTPPLPIDLTGGGGAPSPLMTLLQPTLTLHTPAGDVVVAPAGQSLGVNGTAATWAAYIGLGMAALVGLGVYLGYNAKN